MDVKTSFKIKNCLSNFLGIRDIFSDLKEVGWKINAFLFFVTSWYFIWTFALSSLKVNAIEIVGVLSAITGAFGGALRSMKKISNYIWGVISLVLYAVYAFYNSLFGETLVSLLFYVPLLLLGYIDWSFNMNKKENVVKIKTFKLKYLFIGFISFFLLTVMWWYFIPWIGSLLSKSHKYDFAWWSSLHILDTLTNSLSMVASVFIQFRMGMGFLIYLLHNPLEISIWVINFRLNMIVMICIYFITSLMGVYKWYNLGPKISKLWNKNSKIKSSKNK